MFSKFQIIHKITCSQRFICNYTTKELINPENRLRTTEKFSSYTLGTHMTSALPAKRAAVLVPICVINGQVSLLYTLRAASLKSHRGQVSFPGGISENTDTSLRETALRETQEELGINAKDIDVWGEGKLINSRNIVTVLPVIGEIHPRVFANKLKVNPSEVQDVFTVTIKDLCEPKNRGHTQFREGYALPLFLGGKSRIWGLTAIITNMFLASFIPNNEYDGKVKHLPSVLKLEKKENRK